MSDADPSPGQTQKARPYPSAPGTIDHSDSARFEGEVDMAAERPSTTLHGLRPDGTTKWLVGGLVGGSLLLAAIISLVRGSDDDEAAPRNPDVVVLAPRLEAPLVQAIVGLEVVRMDAISAHAVRAMVDAPKRRELARRTPPAAATPTAAPPRDHVTPARTTTTTSRSPTSVRDLPAPQVDAPPPSDVDPPAAAPADPPRDDAAGAKPPALPSVVDDDDAAPPDDRSTAPS